MTDGCSNRLSYLREAARRPSGPTQRYVDRHADPKDRRRVVLRLSDKGRAAGSVIGATAARVEQDVSHRLGEETVLQLRRALRGFGDGPGCRSATGPP